MTPTFSEIVAARHRIASGINITPCEPSPLLSELCGCEIYTKLEYLQHTGSFKERGARNALLLLDVERQKKGVIAASAGNHALALAYHGRSLGIPVTVVMPVVAPLVKQERCKQFGATVLLSGANIGEAKLAADLLAAEKDLTYIHGFDDPDVIAGAGTIGLEILERVPDVDAIVVPIGGAGLIAGLGLAVKTIKSDVEVIGVEPTHARSFALALEAGEPVKIALEPTLGDGLAVPMVGPRAFALARTVTDRVVDVDEESIALAILRLVELEKGVVEGAGASPLAAILSGKLDHLKGKKVVLVLCGGNIDPAVLGRVIDHGLVADGRLVQFRSTISDRPGGLARLAQAIADAGASVKQITHERAFSQANFASVEVFCTVETRGKDHAAELFEKLSQLGMPCRAIDY